MKGATKQPTTQYYYFTDVKDFIEANYLAIENTSLIRLPASIRHAQNKEELIKAIKPELTWFLVACEVGKKWFDAVFGFDLLAENDIYIGGSFDINLYGVDTRNIILMGDAEMRVEMFDNARANFHLLHDAELDLELNNGSSANAHAVGSAKIDVKTWGISKFTANLFGSAAGTIVAWEHSNIAVHNYESNVTSITMREKSTAIGKFYCNSSGTVSATRSSQIDIEMSDQSKVDIEITGNAHCAVMSYGQSKVNICTNENGTAEIDLSDEALGDIIQEKPDSVTCCIKPGAPGVVACTHTLKIKGK